MAIGSRNPARPPNRVVPQIYKDEVKVSDINEIFRRINELGSTIEGRRGPIQFKDSGFFNSESRNTMLRLKGKGTRAEGSIAFEGTMGSSMYLAKGAYRTDEGSWIATDSSPIIFELTSTGVSPQMYRNTGIVVGSQFNPQPVGFVAVGTSSGSSATETIAPRMPLPHAHGGRDIRGWYEEQSFLHFHNHPHTHNQTDITGASSPGSPTLELQRWDPHTHNYTDLVGSQLLLPDGSAAAPALSFSSNADTGFNMIGTVPYYSYNATNWMRFQDGLYIAGAGGKLGWTDVAAGGTVDVVLQRDAANTLAQRNGTVAQTFRIYNTYTSAASSEYGGFAWAGNTFYVFNDRSSGGGGSYRDLSISTAGPTSINLRTDSTVRWSVGSTGTLTGLGTSDVVQLAVKANASQTANLQEWQNSSGTPLSFIDKDGSSTSWVLAGQIFGP